MDPHVGDIENLLSKSSKLQEKEVLTDAEK